MQSHLGECVELLLSVTLPACLGFAVISAHIANVVLGADFRVMAAQTMPIVAGAVIFQILTQQYLHTSFLLSGRNSFYLINTALDHRGQCGPVLRPDQRLSARSAPPGRGLAPTSFGFVCALVLSRRAFPVPFPLGRLAPILIAALVMALLVAALDRGLQVSDLTACFDPVRRRNCQSTRRCAGLSTSPGPADAPETRVLLCSEPDSQTSRLDRDQ